MSNINQYFTDWDVSAIPRLYPLTKDPVTKLPVKGSPVDGDPIPGNLYDRSAAERYFSQTWASDVSEIFACGDIGTLTLESVLVFDSVEYAVDSIVNVAHLGEVFEVGLKVII